MSTPADHLLLVLAEVVRCPDCDSTVERQPGPDGVLRLIVAHDLTCPNWLRSGARPTTYLTTSEEEDR